jgi:threonine/homoserine/homoserine lactone efflux protein
MTLQGWLVFALFWVVFVTTPGPNAVNCLMNGMQHGFRTSLLGVLGILTQAALFLTIAALGVAALIAGSPLLYQTMKLVGAAVLVWLGLRGWLSAGRPPVPRPIAGHHIYTRALAIASINAKSVVGYLAAFTQFIEPGVPIWHQMAAIYPTALTLTALSYSGYTALGAAMGRAAMGKVLNLWFRRAMAVAFVIYGLLLGLSGTSHVRA